MRKIPRAPQINRDNWLADRTRGLRVLHVGCTDFPMTAAQIKDGNLLHAKLASGAGRLVGLDIDAEGIRVLSGLMPGYEFVCHDVEDLENCAALKGQEFDVVVAADTIEHLSNLGFFLHGVRGMLRPETRLLITTPHAFALKRLLSMAIQRLEHVHPDHTAYFSLSTLSQLLSRHGLEIEQFFMFQWRHAALKNRVINALLFPALWLTGGRLCDEIAIVARLKRDESGENGNAP